MLFSVIVPFYNSADYIVECVESVLNQSFDSYELILINDGSTDDSILKLNVFGNSEKVHILSKENGGQGSARNLGISHAKGRWLVFLDSDDAWHVDRLRSLSEDIKKYSNVDVLFCSGYLCNSSLEIQRDYNNLVGEFNGDEMKKILIKDNPIALMSLGIRKEAINTIGNFDESRVIQNCEDWDLLLRLAIAGHNFFGNPEKLFYYRRHLNNVTNNLIKIRAAYFSVVLKNLIEGQFPEKIMDDVRQSYRREIFGFLKMNMFDHVEYHLTRKNGVVLLNLLETTIILMYVKYRKRLASLCKKSKYFHFIL
jgi:teichuronic acid biosynthesis glycosyltransferase TuaG